MSQGRRIATTARTALALAAAAGLVAAGGCRADRSDGKVAAIVVVPEAERATLGASGDDPDVQDAKLEVPPATKNGPAGFTTAEQIGILEKQCQAIQAEDPSEGGDVTSASGLVWRGDQGAPDLGPPPKDNTFVLVEGDAEFLDPNLVAESAGNTIASQMFEPLLNIPVGNGKPVPGQAERFEVSDDGLVYTFHLRDGLVWSDGKPVTAHDFEYAWKRGLAPETASKNAQQLWYLKNAQAYNKGAIDDPSQVGVKALDDKTLRVELAAPAAFFPDLVTYVAYAPVPRHAIDKFGKQWTRPENIVVNGPFKMTDWEPRNQIVMVKNPTYWDADSVAIDKTVVLLSDSEDKNLNYYKTGQAHVIKPVPPTAIREYIQKGRSDMYIAEQMCTYYYILRTTKAPFDNPQVRRAFNMAIDKERLTKHVLASFQVPARNLLSRMFEQNLGYRPVKGDPFDPQRARELLAQAGYPDGAGLPVVEIVYNTFEVHRLIAEFVQRNLKENLGVEVTVNNMEWKSLLKKQLSGDFQISRTAWCADYPDPMTFLEVFHSDSANNYAAYKNPAYDELLDRIKRETDTGKRNVLICAAEKALNRDVPMMPFYFYTRTYMKRSFIEGYEPQYQDHHLVKDVRIERGGGR